MKIYVLFIIIFSFITFSCTNNFSNGEDLMKIGKYKEAIESFKLITKDCIKANTEIK